jgi:hypothetical protein
MSKQVRPEVGHIWKRKTGQAVSRRLSRRLGLPDFDREMALVRRITNSHVYYRRDIADGSATHMIELAKFLRLFAFVCVVTMPSSSTPAAACAVQ